MKNNNTIVGILFLPFILACGLISSPKVNAFVEGIWVPTDHTLEFMDQLGYEFTEHSIEFFSDGSVEFTNIPAEWIFTHTLPNKDFYSGDGTWSLSKQLIINLGDIQPIVHISSPVGDGATIQFGTVLDHLEFVPVNKPEEVHWVTFQKCYPAMHITDNLLRPLVKALSQSPRDRLGFFPITLEDRIEIDGIVGGSDVWLHAYNDFSSHDIFFRLRNAEYLWVHEEEAFTGPEKWVDYDAATWEETIYIQYQTEEIGGGPVNDLMVDYIGHDQGLLEILNASNSWYLSNDINDVLPILEKWRQWRASEPPSPESLCP